MSRSKKWRLEWAFFLGEKAGGSITISVKNVFMAASRVSGRVWSLVRYYNSKNSLNPVKIRVEKPQNNSLYPYFQKGAFMIFHVSVCLLAHEEKGLISNTFCHIKREYSFSVRPIGCTPAFFIYFHHYRRLFRFRYTFYHVNDYGIKLCGVLRCDDWTPGILFDILSNLTGIAATTTGNLLTFRNPSG